VTYATEKATIGRKPLTVCELILDTCAEVYGVGSCTAGNVAEDTAQSGAATTITLAAGDTQADDYYNDMVIKITGGTGSGQEKTITDYVNSTKVATVSTWSTNPDNTSTYTIHNVNSSEACYNTRETCQDSANYNKTTKTYRFCEGRSDLPIGIDMYPCISATPTFTSTKIVPGKGLSIRGAVSVNFQDFPHHDRMVDPYVANRTYTPEDQGTFFGKLITRNRHYLGRSMRIRSGYITDTWNWDNFEDRYYVIDNISGPDYNGKVTVHGKDILELASDSKTKVPALSSGKLTGAINGTDTSLSVTTGTGTDYPTSGTVKVGSELIKYSGKSTDTLTGLTRGQWGTTAAAHAVDDLVQECLTYESINVVNIINDLLTTYAGISASYIPFNDNPGSPDEWDDEKADWLSAHDFTTVLHSPTGVKTILDELVVDAMLNLWWDEINQKVKLKAIVPPQGPTVTALNDTSHILEGSLSIKPDESLRLSQVWLNYAKINYVEGNDPDNFDRGQISANLGRESADRYNDSKPVTITSRWMDSSNDGSASQLTGRMLARFSDAPKIAVFDLDAKNSSVAVGDLVDITSCQIQTDTGSDGTVRFEIVERNELNQGHKFRYTGLESKFVGAYAYVGPDTLLDYTDESEANQGGYCYVSDASGKYSNGDTAATII